MLDGIYSLPIQTLAFLTAALFVGTYWAGCFLIRPFLRMFIRVGERGSEIVGTILSAFVGFFGLLLSLIAVAAYENLSRVDAHVINEASALIALFHDVSEFGDPQRSELQGLLVEYCEFTIDEEWPIQRNGMVPMNAGPRLRAVRKQLLDYEPRTRSDDILYAAAFERLEELAEHGRHRRYAAKTGIPQVMWYVVIVGTVINYVLMWRFDIKFVTQLFLGGLVAFFLGALILLIAVLDRPYRSIEFGVSSQPFELARVEMLESIRVTADDEG